MSHPARRKQVAVAVAAAAVLMLLVWVYGTFDPSHLPFPRCMIKTITGYDCPGCGSQRATHALLCGNIRDVLRYNLLYLPALAYIFITLAAKALSSKIYRMLTGRTACLLILAMIIGWWIMRNCFSIIE